MEILFIIVPISIVIAALAVWAFLWGVKSGQFEDEGHKIAEKVVLDD